MSKPVLLIEDDPDIRALVEMTLRMDGIQVTSFGCGAEGLKALAETDFSLVILDVMMPDMSGYEVLQRMTGLPEDKRPPVALFTARPEDATAGDIRNHGVVHILPKPFEPDRMSRTVQALMRK